jgi:hypothetical protein
MSSSDNKQEQLNTLKKNLEEEAMKKVSTLKQTNLPIEKNVSAIMQEGFDTFKKETGRGMTYGEMRELYG